MNGTKGKVATETSIFETTVTQKPKRGDVTCCLVYPNTYSAGMSSLGFQTLYRLFNQAEGIWCDRAFLPGKPEKTNDIRSHEYGSPLLSFDILAFSISFENDYINVVSLLREAGIPPRSSGRNRSHPLVIAGGVACFLNPEPLAPFIDCFLLGEAETFIQDFCRICLTEKERESFLKKAAASLQCAYVPKFYKAASKNSKPPFLAVPLSEFAPFPVKTRQADLTAIRTTSAFLTAKTAFKDIFLIETGRGCPHGCRFCSAGFIYRPPRFYPEKTISAAMDEAEGKTNRIGLVSTAVSDHPAINTICKNAIHRKMKLSFSSFRADMLAKTVVKKLGQTSVKTASIAPEAGSQRLRNSINKQISEDEILNCTELLVSAGVINLRLYFLVGLPCEKREDVDEIVKLVKKIKAVFLASARKRKKIGTITLSVNPFIPKPVTPFQWASFSSDSQLKEKFQIIKNGLKRVPNVKINFESIKSSKINALLSRGDRACADIIETALMSGWTKALKQNRNYVETVLYQKRDPDDPLPWDIVDTGVKKDYLIKELANAQKGHTTADCPMTDCIKCGICRQAD